MNLRSLPKQKRLDEIYWLSNERRLYLRLTSPHEYGESVDEFIGKTRGKMDVGRWCFACPFQPDAFRSMPDVVATVEAFIAAFTPERVRVALISPNRHGATAGTFLPGRDIVDELLSLPGVEVLAIDGRRRNVNGLLLADFFDFT